MTNALYTLVGAGLVLGVMILVHEFGHFAAAKLLGVRVEVFSIGFGKRLLGFRRGDTDYRISALPLGGYVKMTGVSAIEMPEEHADGRICRPRRVYAASALAAGDHRRGRTGGQRGARRRPADGGLLPCVMRSPMGCTGRRWWAGACRAIRRRRPG